MVISAPLLSGHPAKIKTLKRQVEVLLRGRENNNKHFRECLHRWIVGGRKILKWWMQPTSLSIFLLSCKCYTSPGVWRGTMEDKREKNVLFFPPLFFKGTLYAVQKAEGTAAFKNLLSPGGNLPVDDIEVKEKCTATFANDIWANWTPKVRIWLGARTRTAVTLFLVQQRMQLARLLHSSFPPFFSFFTFQHRQRNAECKYGRVPVSKKCIDSV